MSYLLGTAINGSLPGEQLLRDCLISPSPLSGRVDIGRFRAVDGPKNKKK